MVLNGYGFELDFLPVGTGAKSGDAIAMRIGIPDVVADLVVIDGGSLESGRALVDHIRDRYGNPTYIANVVCTHPDDDHTSGLREVVDAFAIGTLWIHQPWLHAAELVPAFRYNWSEAGLEKHLKECFSIPFELCEAAAAKGAQLAEPFQGSTIGGLSVLAPSYSRYLELVPQMNRTPVARSMAEAAGSMFKAVRDTVLSVFETWSWETLGTPKPGDTSATNETSVVLFGDFGDCRVLLTGDAGVEGLAEAFGYAAAAGLPFRQPDCVQMPHHGSRRNVSPALLTELLGAPLDVEGATRSGWAVASASAGDAHHPRKVVQNAFRRRGYRCTQTHGLTLTYTHRYPQRSGIVAMPAEPFHNYVEE